MVGLQRFWMLCLLVIAGSGPLPLWLHHSVCHGHSCDAHDQFPTPTKAHGCCDHDHGVKLADKASRSVDQWDRGDDSHEDCVVCYTLAQLTTAPPANDFLVGHPVAQYVIQAGDSQASLEILSAYSSRGPPTADLV